MKKYTTLFVFVLIIFNLNAKDYTVSSPSKNISVKISVNEDISYSVFFNGSEIISPSKISMSLENGLVLGENAKVRKATTTLINQEIIPVVQRKYAKIENK